MSTESTSAEPTPPSFSKAVQSPVSLWTQCKDVLSSPSVKHFIAGGVAGAVSRTVVSPLERMKIIFQVQGPGNSSYHGVWGTLAKIWKEEGIVGYLRGNGTNVVRIAPYSAVQFASYEQYRKLLSNANGELNTVRRLTAGALAGITSVIATYPLDIIRTRLSIQSSAIAAKDGGLQKLPGMWDTGKRIYVHDGIRGLYRGLGATLTGVGPYVALNFYFYESTRTMLITTPEENTTPRKLLCGAIAGSMAQTLTYPLDVLRRRMQVTGMDSMPVYSSTMDAVRKIVANEGFFRGLYKGIVPNLLKVAPSIGTSFATYEFCKEWLGA